jgi:ABC-2 type transport system ATP-binding protein
MGQRFLDLRDLSHYYGAFPALQGVTLQLPPGRVGLLGPNGAGKSTLLKILMGLIPPSSGTGWVFDVPLADDRDPAANRRLRQLIGFMPEADALIPGLTGLEYVALAGELYGMPRAQAQRRAHEVLGFLGLEEARYRPVEGYSLGMKQRVKLAQALVHDPVVLLLDEPTSGLDPAGRDAFLRLIEELGRDHGKSVLLSTHLLADVQAVCEYVVILAGGRVRGEGTVSQLCARRHDRFRIRYQGDPQRFRQALQAKQIRLLEEADAGEFRVAVPDNWTNRRFFELALATGGVIRCLVQDDETLEELFLRLIGN